MSFRTLILLFVLLWLPQTVQATPLKTGTVIHRKYRMPQSQKQIPYSFYLPKKYDGTTRLPVVFALHGLFSNCYQILRYPGLMSAAEKHGFILVAPMGYNSHGWYGMFGKERFGDIPSNLGELSERDVLNVITMVRRELKIDAQRIYLFGHSMGGGGSLHLLGKYPDQFAAVATVSPAFFIPHRGQALRNINSPILIIQGTLDPLVNVYLTRSLVTEIENINKHVKYIEVEGGEHLIPALTHWNEIFGFFQRNKLAQGAPLPVFK